MKKILFCLGVASMALAFTGCSDNPEDAVSKHVYGESESPYLRTDASATISYSAEFRKGHISDKVIYLKDYAEQIQTKMKMTVDDMIANLETGKVVFYNINTSRGIWNKTASTKGDYGWYYNAAGGIVSSSEGVASIELDKTNKALILSMPEESVAGVTSSANVGFAVNNGSDYDDYIRFSISFAVTDPGTIVQSISIPTGDYATTEYEFSNCENAIKECLGMTLSEFVEIVSDTEGDIAMYLVDDDGNWDTTSSYSANGIGYWVDINNKVSSWSSNGYSDGRLYFVETHADNKSVGIGRAPGVPSGTEGKVHFVYAKKSDSSAFIEFVFTTTFQ